MSKESISALLHQLGNMVEQGCFDNISEEVIDGAAAVLKSILNVDVTFEQAKRITGKSEAALRSSAAVQASTPAKSPVQVSRHGGDPGQEKIVHPLHLIF